MTYSSEFDQMDEPTSPDSGSTHDSASLETIDSAFTAVRAQTRDAAGKKKLRAFGRSLFDQVYPLVAADRIELKVALSRALMIGAAEIPRDLVDDELLHHVAKYSLSGRDPFGKKPRDKKPKEKKPTVVVDERPDEYSDDVLALRFENEHAGHLRYVAKWGRWFKFDGQRWVEDNTHAAFDLSRSVCREAAQTCKSKKIRAAVRSAKSVAAVLTMARSARRIAATTEQWDANPWLLNTPAGVVDLRTGETRPHQPEDYMTKMTGVAPDPNCDTLLWLDFLDKITAGDDDLIAFLGRMAGYSLTGTTHEHSLFFLYGRGRNGKSTFINAVQQCAGDYHTTSPIETFTEPNGGERHSTEVACLHGARLVTAVETEESRHWAESRIKQLTGGDKISARFMRQDFFEFTPQFKLIIAGNHKPRLRSVDEAIKARFKLVPFGVTIPEKERDLTFGDKLRAELPGILHWMIQGCLDWQEVGLNPPDAVSKATATYLDSEDPTAAWIEENCIRDASAETSRTRLHADWAKWAVGAGEKAGSSTAFYDRLEGKGFEQHRTEKARFFRGLRLKDPLS